MSRSRTQRRQEQQTVVATQRRSTRQLLSTLVPAALLLGAGLGWTATWRLSFHPQPQLTPLAATAAGLPAPTPPSPAADLLESKSLSLAELLEMDEASLARVDVAEANLLCARGLPGSDGLDFPAYLAGLDEWAARVKTEAARHFHQFQSRPEEWDGSEGQFHMMAVE